MGSQGRPAVPDSVEAGVLAVAAGTGVRGRSGSALVEAVSDGGGAGVVPVDGAGEGDGAVRGGGVTAVAGRAARVGAGVGATDGAGAVAAGAEMVAATAGVEVALGRGADPSGAAGPAARGVGVACG